MDCICLSSCQASSGMLYGRRRRQPAEQSCSVDLGGVFITPVEKDFIKITAEDIAQILGEVCLSPADFQKVRKRIQEQL